MLKDITIGQYFPGDSIVHRMDCRMKIILTFVYIVMLFVASNMWGMLISAVFLIAVYLLSKIPLKMILKSLKPVIPIILLTAILNLFFVSGTGEPLVAFWIIKS